MKICRAIFVNADRISDLILTLKFDQFLSPCPIPTHIFYGPWDPEVSIQNAMHRHKIDSQNFEIYRDQELFVSNPPSIDIYQFGGWISQQLLKFIVVDRLDYDVLLIQDCDTFCIEPYRWWTAPDQLTMYYLTDRPLERNYDEFVKTITGQPGQAGHPLMSEFMPVMKKHWQDLKTKIERDFAMDWLAALHQMFCQQPVGPQIAFSEYEVLGNWNLLCHPFVQLQEQKRFNLTPNWRNRIKELATCNCIANNGSVPLDQVSVTAEWFLDLKHQNQTSEKETA